MTVGARLNVVPVLADNVRCNPALELVEGGDPDRY